MLAELSSPGVQRVGLLAYLVAGGFLLAHSINAVIGDALYLPPRERAYKLASERPRPVTYAPNQAADEIRGSGLFLLPAIPAPPADLAVSVSAPVHGSLGLASKIRLIGVVFNDQRGVF